MKSLILCAMGAVVIVGYMVCTNLNNPKLLYAMLGMPIFIFVMLLVVFGKDLFKKNKKPNNTSSTKEAKK